MSGKLPIPGIVSTLTVAAGFVMSTRVDLGLVHDYVFLMAMAIFFTMDWTTRGHVNAEVLGFGIVLVSITTLPFKGPLLRNHVALIMLLMFKIARLGYGHEKVSAPRYRNCVSPRVELSTAKPASKSITTTYIISSTT
ncbi:hypothetical protein ScalyP_jg766 [Parmales sp. scaly parma]|nr:hypothetical protein ScalyP_jg766 [Parmales sp. scaly parma]